MGMDWTDKKGMHWTDRLEAIKLYIFDLEGNVIARDVLQRVPNGFTLREAIERTRSAVCEPIVIVCLTELRTMLHRIPLYEDTFAGIAVNSSFGLCIEL